MDIERSLKDNAIQIGKFYDFPELRRKPEHPYAVFNSHLIDFPANPDKYAIKLFDWFVRETIGSIEGFESEYKSKNEFLRMRQSAFRTSIFKAEGPRKCVTTVNSLVKIPSDDLATIVETYLPIQRFDTETFNENLRRLFDSFGQGTFEPRLLLATPKGKLNKITEKRLTEGTNFYIKQVQMPYNHATIMSVAKREFQNY